MQEDEPIGDPERTKTRLFIRLAQLYPETLEPFPYSDCRKIRRSASHRSKRYRYLVPDLALYWSDIAGFVWPPSGWWLKKSCDELRQLQQSCFRADFFTRYPQYKSLRLLLSRSRTPRLHRGIIAHEEMRQIINMLIDMACAGDKPRETFQE